MALFRVLDPNIKLILSSDGHKLTASDISETKANEIRLITNNSANNARLHFDEVLVYLNNELEPSPVYGFFPICLQRLEREDVIAFSEGRPTYQPFIYGFQDGISINELCDRLSYLAVGSPDTFGKVKNYTMVFGNGCQGGPNCYSVKIGGETYCYVSREGKEKGMSNRDCRT